jgi:hypothetical protein
VSCAGASSVSVDLGITAAITLNLTNLAASVPVYIRVTNNSGGALVFKINGTNASGAAFTFVQAVFVSAGAETAMNTTGFSMANGTAQHFHGALIGGSANLLAFLSL